MKINKRFLFLLIFCFLIFGFTTILNFTTALAQEFSFETAKSDFIFTQDNYRENLTIFNSKKEAYQKNPTLSLKEEVRISFLQFLIKRIEYKKAYLNLIRVKTKELESLSVEEKGAVFEKIDPEVIWYEKRKENFGNNDSLEDLLNKSTEDDLHYKEKSLPVIYFGLGYISLAEAIDLKNQNQKIYEELKKESENLIKLGRADSKLFDRWFKDIDAELTNIQNILGLTKKEIENIFSVENYSIKKSFEKIIETLTPVRGSLLRLNKFVYELESAVSEKR